MSWFSVFAIYVKDCLFVEHHTLGLWVSVAVTLQCAEFRKVAEKLSDCV